MDLEAVTQYRCSNKHFPKARKKPGGVLPTVGYTGRLRPKGVPFFKLVVCKKVRKIAILVYERVHKISCKVEEMVAKAKYIKRCHILAEMTTQLNQND